MINSTWLHARRPSRWGRGFESRPKLQKAQVLKDDSYLGTQLSPEEVAHSPGGQNNRLLQPHEVMVSIFTLSLPFRNELSLELYWSVIFRALSLTRSKLSAWAEFELFQLASSTNQALLQAQLVGSGLRAKAYRHNPVSPHHINSRLYSYVPHTLVLAFCLNRLFFAYRWFWGL